MSGSSAVLLFHTFCKEEKTELLSKLTWQELKNTTRRIKSIHPETAEKDINVIKTGLLNTDRDKHPLHVLTLGD